MAGATWSLSLFFYTQPILFSGLTWIKVVFSLVFFLIASSLYFSFVFPEERTEAANRWQVVYWSTAAVFLYLLWFTNKWVKGVVETDWGFETILGPAYKYWGLFNLLFGGLIFRNFIRKYATYKGIVRLQLKYIFVGVFILAVGTIIVDIIVPLYAGSSKYFWASSLFIVPFITSTSYAIIRYRLLDLRLLVKNLIVKTIIAIVLSLISGTATYFYGLVFERSVPREVIFPIIGAMIFIVFSFEYLAEKSGNFTRRYLFRSGYEPKILLEKLTDILSSTIGFEEMLTHVSKTLKEELNIKFAGFLLMDSQIDEGKDYRFISSGDKKVNWDNINSLIKFTESNQSPFIQEELSKKATQMNDHLTQEIVNQMKFKEIATILPIRTKETLNGFLFIGEKPSLDAFTLNELRVLENFTPQTSFAVENARLFSEIQTFNAKLKEEIRKATHELTDQNRFLAALRRLDLIIMETLDINSLCQKIVDALSLELRCQFGLIGLIDENHNRLYFKAITSQSQLARLLASRKIAIEDIYFPLDIENGSVTKTINTKREIYAENLVDVFPPSLSPVKLKKWQMKIKTQTYWAYPIISKTKVLGVLVFAWKKAEREISSRERDLMQSVIDQTGIALDNTLLYDRLEKSIGKLRKINLKLRELDRMKDEFVSIASHELRTPMTAVNNYIWMTLHGKGGKISQKQQFYLERAALSTKRLISLVEDMLTVSRIEGGKLEVNPTPGNIVALAKNVFEELQPKAKEKKIKTFLETPKKELPLVSLDQDRIREVLLNLIGNAIKFTDINGTIKISFKRKGKLISTQISDTGRGIAKSDIPKLFKKFGRLEKSFATVAETGGTGLGLYICKQIIDLHHGKIGAESKPEKGSTFYFNLKVTEEVKP